MRDLSLGGCCLETVPALERGVRAEIVVRINSGSFRAVSQVKGIRDRFGVGMEFVQLSACGKDMLADVLERLASLQALVNELRSARRGIDAETLVQQHWPLLRALLPPEPRENAADKAHSDSAAVQAELEIIRLDLFI
jgi:hypothetical protein